MSRCHLEYANSVCSHHRQGLIKEKIQLRDTKMTVNHLSFKERLERLKLPIHLNTDVQQVT